MKKMCKAAGMIMMLILMTLMLGGCTSDKSEIKDTLGRFEDACRNLDLDEMLDCIEPNVADPIRLGMAIYSGATGQEYKDFVDGTFDQLVTAVFGEDLESNDFLSSISISDAKCEVEKENAAVTCMVKFEIAGEKFERETTVYLHKKGDKWYIYNFEM